MFRYRWAAAFALATAATVPAPYRAAAQAPTRLARIGWLSRLAPTAADKNLDALRVGMRDHGYVEGQTFTIEPRFSNGNPDRMPALAKELEDAGVNVIVAGAFEGLQAATLSTRRVPLVMTPSADPVVAGLVTSLTRPGGRITGITEMMPELTTARLRILKQIVPTVRRVAILWQPGTLTDEAAARTLEETQTAAREIHVEVLLVGATSAGDFDAVFETMAGERVDGLVVLSNPLFAAQRQPLVDHVARQRLPAIYEGTSFVELGGLISYGADIPDVYRRAAGLVDQILKGANPGDLPIEGPTRSDLGVNLKTATALGVTIPADLVKQAALVIK